MDSLHYQLMTNRKAGSRGLLANIPEENSPAGPWKFWKDASTPRFPRAHGYTYGSSFDVFGDDDVDLAAKAAALSEASNFTVAASSQTAGTWKTNEGGIFIESGGLAWKPYKHCEKLGFATNCSLAETGEITLGMLTWLKPGGGAAFDPAFGRPYSGQGGFRQAGVTSDHTDWYVNPSAIKGGSWGLDANGDAAGTEQRWRWLAGEQVQASCSYGPYDTKFLCAICWKKSGNTWAAFPLYWTTSAMAPDGWDTAKIGAKLYDELGDSFVGIHFDIRVHAVVWGVLPARNANDAHTGPDLPTHSSNVFWTDSGGEWIRPQRPNNLYFNTSLTFSVRVVAAVAI